jgi:hypothetical protein
VTALERFDLELGRPARTIQSYPFHNVPEDPGQTHSYGNFFPISVEFSIVKTGPNRMFPSEMDIWCAIIN